MGGACAARKKAEAARADRTKFKRMYCLFIGRKSGLMPGRLEVRPLVEDSAVVKTPPIYLNAGYLSGI